MIEQVVVSDGDDSQNVVFKLTSDINTKLGKEHFSYHVVTAETTNNAEGAIVQLKLKSNDGQLYEAKIFRPKLEGSAPSVINCRWLYEDIPVEDYHREKIAKYLPTINETYKTSNTKYNIVSVQQQIDDKTNHVYRVVGAEDCKHYKIKIQRPTILHEGEPIARKDKAQ